MAALELRHPGHLVTIPIVGLTLLILLLNIVAPSSHDVRVINYVVAVNAACQRPGNRRPDQAKPAHRKGDMLFKLDPRPIEIE